VQSVPPAASRRGKEIGERGGPRRGKLTGGKEAWGRLAELVLKPLRPRLEGADRG